MNTFWQDLAEQTDMGWTAAQAQAAFRAAVAGGQSMLTPAPNFKPRESSNSLEVVYRRMHREERQRSAA